MVGLPKSNDEILLCVDYETGVNDRTVIANHAISIIKNILHNLSNFKFFCKLDFLKAYLHVPVDEKSRKSQTVTSHKGDLHMNQSSFGIKTALAEFNRIISEILAGLNNEDVLFDDIIVHGESKEDCLQNAGACLQRLCEFSLHLKPNKCEFLTTNSNI